MALKYDTDSGQVYFEAICSALSADPPWTYCKTVLGQSENYNYFLPDVLERSREAHRIEFDRRQRPQKGATKLLAICERTCTDNIDSLTLSVLREVPAHLGKRIYDIATNRSVFRPVALIVKATRAKLNIYLLQKLTESQILEGFRSCLPAYFRSRA